MLRLLQGFAKLRTLPALYLRGSRFGTKRNQPEEAPPNEADLAATYSKRYSKKRTVKKVVESLYFPDHSQQTLREEINKKSTDEETLDDKDFRAASRLHSTDVKRIAEDGRKEGPTSKEEIIELIGRTRVNEILLRTYQKHFRFFAKGPILALLRQLEANLASQKTVEAEERARFEQRRARMKALKTKGDLRFTLKFPSKEELVQQPGFKMLVDFLGKKFVHSDTKPHFVLDIAHRLISFLGELPLTLRSLVKNLIERRVETMSLEELSKSMRLLTAPEKLDLTKEEVKHMLDRVEGVLCQCELTSLRPDDIPRIVESLTRLRSRRASAVFFRLEPHILRHINELSPNVVVRILRAYVTTRSGSPQFIELLVAQALRHGKALSFTDTTSLVDVLQPRRLKREDINADPSSVFIALRDNLTKDISALQRKPLTLPKALNFALKYHSANEAFIELATAEFVKAVTRVEVRAWFINSYFLLAEANCQSTNLIAAVEKPFRRALDELAKLLDVKPVGLLEPPTPSSNVEVKPIQVVEAESSSSVGYSPYLTGHLYTLTKLAWAHTHFAFCAAGEASPATKLDFEAWKQLVSLIRLTIGRLIELKAPFRMKKTTLELLLQVNDFIVTETPSVQPLDLGGIINQSLLRVEGTRYSRKMTFEQAAFLLEKKIFFKKYGANLERFFSYRDYVVDWRLENASARTTTLLFINEPTDYVDEQTPKAHVLRRRDIFAAKDIPIIEVGYFELTAAIAECERNGQLFFETRLREALRGLTPQLESADQEKLKRLVDQLTQLRTEHQKARSDGRSLQLSEATLASLRSVVDSPSASGEEDDDEGGLGGDGAGFSDYESSDEGEATAQKG